MWACTTGMGSKQRVAICCGAVTCLVSCVGAVRGGPAHIRAPKSDDPE